MQFEFPWALGPPDGRYIVRDPGDGATTHVLQLATLGAPERRRLRGRRGREAAPEPEPTPVVTARVTVIEATPVSPDEAAASLQAADPATAELALAPLSRAVRAYRLASGDPHVHEPALSQALVIRAGYGAGEQVAVGRWMEARELASSSEGRQRRRTILHPHERLAALLGGHARPLACEELALRARHDLDHDQLREAALQLRVAFDAALAELPVEAQELGSAAFAERIATLADDHTTVVALADAALGGVLPPNASETLGAALGRLEAALRARSAAQSNPRL